MGAAGNALGSNKPDNPDYLLIRAQLDAVRNGLAALRARVVKARADLAHYEEQISISPGVERQYIDLTRTYQSEAARYADLQAKIKAAAVAREFEGEARGERFTLVRPANTPSSPVFPNRLGVILIGILLGTALAFGAAAVVEASDPTVRGADDLEDIFETSPLGAVPPIRNRRDVRRRRLAFTSVTAVYLLATGVVALAVVSAI
jgi:polysaccharide biosynthesis transport protein